MPPKAKITKEMIIDAGFEIVRTEGESELNVRRIAARLGCSTQPVMYHFPTVEDLKNEILRKADQYHTQYIMNVDFENTNPMLGIGLRYILFGAEEKNLFCFLFQSDKLPKSSFTELLDSEDLSPIFGILQEQAGITAEQSREAFGALFLTVHGIASMLANNSMEYDEKYCENVLTNVFFGVIGVMKGGSV